MNLFREAPELPIDLVTGEILTRLPVKSLMRFKCVSKLWLSLICSKYFTKLFIMVPSPRLYMCCNNLILSLAPSVTSTSPSSSFVVDDDLTISRDVGLIYHNNLCDFTGMIYQNLCGFMCYVYKNCPRFYNPATGQLVTVPGIKSKNMIILPQAEKDHNYFFGYDPVNHQYKVLSLISVYTEKKFISSEHWVFVLKAGGGSWKKAAPTPLDFCPRVTSKGLCIDGVIYYLAWIDPNKSLVVRFDIKSEEFSMIQVPRRDGDEKPKTIRYVTLIDYGGKPTLFDYTKLKKEGVVSLWTVEDVGSKEWSCKSLLVQPSQLHLVSWCTIRVTGTSQSGKVLLIPTDMICFFYYDLQSNDMREIEIKGIPYDWSSQDPIAFDFMFMDQSESVIYLDT